jgi:hypothetical protein
MYWVIASPVIAARRAPRKNALKALEPLGDAIIEKFFVSNGAALLPHTG